MSDLSGLLSNFLRRCRTASPAMVWMSALNLVALLAFVVLALIDTRQVMGQPVWIKPAKFAVSTTIYAMTLAWMLSFVEGRARAVRWIGRVTAGVMAVEVGLIAVQAGRGVSSHFNVGSGLDAAIFSTMGVSILAVWIAGWVAVVRVWRQPFADRALGAAIRAGLLISVLGAGLGGLMTQPSKAQVEALANGTGARSGAHSVGAPDDAPGLPLVGWNTQGGDLRVPHFFGLHAMQALPLLALALSRSRSARVQRRRAALVWIGAGGYLALVAALTVQALRAEPLLSPSAFTISTLAAVVFATIVAAVAVVARPSASPVVSGSVATS